MLDAAPHAPTERHTTAARKEFAKEFAAAISAIRTLDAREPTWTRPAPPPPPQRAPIDLNGRETVQQLSFKAYGKDTPASFGTTMKHRKRRDDETEFLEALFRQRRLFGKGK